MVITTSPSFFLYIFQNFNHEKFQIQIQTILNIERFVFYAIIVPEV